jgi:hypothetical protein
MDKEKLLQIIGLVSRSNTETIESLFKKPGGKSYLETTVLMVLSTSGYLNDEKEALFNAFLKVTDNMAKRIERQKEGEAILMQVSN